MKKFILILLAVLLVLPVSGECAKRKKKDAKAKKAAEEKKTEQQKKPTKYFMVHFKTGGVYKADNYTIEGDHIMLMLPSGPIFLDKDMVTQIEKFEADPDKPSQVIRVNKETRGSDFVPAEAAPAGEPDVVIEKVPARAEPVPAKRTGTRAEPTPPAPQPEVPEKDDEGHIEGWWKARIKTWDKRHEDAIKKYENAQKDWNKYDGALVTLNAGETASDYDVQRYQDLRGSARIAMDSAREEIVESETMLTDTIPDEARKAGAPKWWAEWDGEKYEFK